MDLRTFVASNCPKKKADLLNRFGPVAIFSPLSTINAVQEHCARHEGLAMTCMDHAVYICVGLVDVCVVQWCNSGALNRRFGGRSERSRAIFQLISGHTYCTLAWFTRFLYSLSFVKFEFGILYEKDGCLLYRVKLDHFGAVLKCRRQSGCLLELRPLVVQRT